MYKLESPLPKDALYVLSLVEIGPSVLEKKKNVKSLWQDDDNNDTDDR